MDKSRQQFEEEYRKHSTLDEVDIFKIDSESDDYYYLETRWAWRWWQESRESLEIELPRKHDVDDEYDYFAMGYNLALNKIHDLLVVKGVKVK